MHSVTNQHAVTQIITIFILQATDKKKNTKVGFYVPSASFIISKLAMCEDSYKRKYKIRQFEERIMQTSFNHLQMCHQLQQLHTYGKSRC